LPEGAHGGNGHNAAGIALGTLAALQPLLYAGMFAGDAVIHLAYGETAAHGRFFEFNPGETSSGETSPGYMLILAALFRLFPPGLIPYAVKILDVSAWLALSFVVWRLAGELIPDRYLAHAAGLVAAALPGSVYNSTVGMENGLFALLVYLAVLAHARLQASHREGAVALLLSAAIWLRPEGVIVAAVWYALVGTRSSWKGLALCLASAAALAAFHHGWTGEWVPASGRSRIWLASLHSWQIGPLHVDPKVALRLLAYAPLTVPAVVGTFALRADEPERDEWRFLAWLLWLCIAAYSLFLGGWHFGRYAIFLMPALVLLAAKGWQRAAGTLPAILLRRWQIAALVALAATFAAEAVYRRRLGSHEALSEAAAAPAARHRRTDALLQALGAPGASQVSLACQEVQRRYFLDQRIVIRSLDGRTDSMLLQFADRQGVDHPAYLRARRVDFLLEFPRYASSADRWTLRDLLATPAFGTVVRGGVRFRRLGSAEAFALEFPDRRLPGGRGGLGRQEM